MRRVIISGGGTGGHIFPAIAIADQIKEAFPNAEIRFVGALGRMEMERVPRAGYPITGLWISGIQRRLTWQNFLFPLKLIYSQWQARRLLKRLQPNVVIGVGGYASGPTLKQASRLGFPTLIQEQNSYAGLTNRWLSKQVDTICVAYEGMERYFPASKIVLTGNPIRQDLLDVSKVDRLEAARYFELDPNKKTILVMGGSLGARTMNEALAGHTELVRESSDIQWIWQMGKFYASEFKEVPTARLANVSASAFLDRMDYAYRLADLVVARAGALTVSELCALSKPSILVPSPVVAEDHQTKNAQALVDKGAALMVSDQNASSQLIDQAIGLVQDEMRLKKLASEAQSLGFPDATKKIVEEIKKLIDQ